MTTRAEALRAGARQAVVQWLKCRSVTTGMLQRTTGPLFQVQVGSPSACRNFLVMSALFVLRSPLGQGARTVHPSSERTPPLWGRFVADGRFGGGGAS